MAFTFHPTVVTGQTWSASDQNTYVTDNLTALWPYTAGGQIAYSDSTATLAAIAIGTQHQFLRSNATNTGLEFGALVLSRQGGSTSDWTTAGTSNTTPTNAVIQCGAVLLTNTVTTVNVTFPIAYSVKPFCLGARGAANTAGVSISANIVSVSTSGITITATSPISTGVTINAFWLAIGQI